jgi:hypothetical protein
LGILRPDLEGRPFSLCDDGLRQCRHALSCALKTN